MAKKNRPSIVDDRHLEYLDRLRESGITNMFGAGPFLEEEFDLDNRQAKKIVVYWMASFSERHPE